MNNSRVIIFLDDLLSGYEQTPALLEQKEELAIHITERIQDYMARGHNYDDAFDVTIRDLGDVKALVTGIAPEKSATHHEGNNYNHNDNNDGRKKDKKRKSVARTLSRIALPLASMSPFIYILLGLAFGWWAWAWVIIPMTGVLITGDWRVIITGMTPFIYFLLGFFFGWWAWGWLIIPMTGCVFTVRHWD